MKRRGASRGDADDERATGCSGRSESADPLGSDLAADTELLPEAPVDYTAAVDEYKQVDCY